MKKNLCCIVLLIFFISCLKENQRDMGVDELLYIPPGFPVPFFPPDNTFNETRFYLGRRLFYDPILSRDSTISCASCHHQEYAFSDTTAFSDGVNRAPGIRNASTLTNVTYNPYFTREGGVPTLEMQIFVPIQEHNEFNFNIVLIADKLKMDSSYVSLCKLAYDRTPDPFCITRAIACFERTLISGQSRYDEFANSSRLDALSNSEKRGLDLFFSTKTNCSSCHSGFNFTNYKFENNGLYENYPDQGKFRLTEDSSDLALFKVPTLRNIELTSPYMHDGSIKSLKDIIEHYNSGGKNHPHKSKLIKSLNLSIQQKEDLLAFLKSLTDEKFIKNKKFRL
ncbi:MAG: cytochrome c peroxidase [Saprospiraceae bacterium]